MLTSAVSTASWPSKSILQEIPPLPNYLAGIAVEGYGVTNNPKPRFRSATFEESRFTLPPEGATPNISVQYFQ